MVTEKRRHVNEDGARTGLVRALTLKLLDVSQDLLEVLSQLLRLEGFGAGGLVDGDDGLRYCGAGCSWPV